MKKQARGDRLKSANGSSVEGRTAVIDAERAMRDDQTAADADQTASDADQTSSDADQAASDAEELSSDIDQRASDRDQETADREHAAWTLNGTDEGAYEQSRGERQSVAIERFGNRLKRARAGRERDATSRRRDIVANARDAAGRIRDARATTKARTSDETDLDLLQRLEALAAEAAADRAKAAADRERAARDREKAARTRARLEAELERAYLDELTGAYRREMGRTALSHEIDRARRSDGRFVLAFVDVDELKAVNDRDGHVAGDRVLQGVTDAIRARLRSFDPIVRWGGDEFVCGLGGTDRTEARRRFIEIAKAIRADVHVGISVGLAALGAIETVDGLTERADAAMLTIKARHHARA
jgi:diguanylate cyclase (GGDEF)-like protein